MSNILDRITDNKRREVEAKRTLDGEIMHRMAQERIPRGVSMSQCLAASPRGIIAEFKRRSPSRGEIHAQADAGSIVAGYEAAGCAACSILTDTRFFGGAITDLATARSRVSIPLLRKDFTVSEYQIDEAAVYGADAILLIASVLSRNEIEAFTSHAHTLGLEVLLELHSRAELDKYTPEADMVGINNRNLTTFDTDPGLSLAMAELLPQDAVKVAESGLSSLDEVLRLREAGYRGFLIGESFMKHDDPAAALRNFLRQ